jgi:hypothetical protein
MNSKMIPMLSKSKYVAGLQCPLRLWHQCYNPHLASPVSPAKQALFDMGHEVGRLATLLYPEGILIETDPLRHEQAIDETIRAMEDPMVKAIFEASFSYDGVRVKVDILERARGGKWNLVEVKSSTQVKNEYLPDVGVQYRVLRGAGLEIGRVTLLHLNNQYVYDGNELDLEQLFTASDLTPEAINGQAGNRRKDWKDSKRCLEGLTHRRSPLQGIVSAHMSASSLITAARGCPSTGSLSLQESAGVDSMSWPRWACRTFMMCRNPFPLTEIQERIRRCVKNNEEYVSRELKDELEAVEYPVHFLDFETLGLAIPRYLGTRPYQSVPFQWSDHVLHEDGRVEHLEYLCEEDKDPREEFARTLLDVLGPKGSIVTYTTYEEGIIKGLAEEFPQYSDQTPCHTGQGQGPSRNHQKKLLSPRIPRFVFLQSCGPALLPEMDYANLIVQEGQQAGLEYLRMIDLSTPVHEREKIREALLAYCGQDTLVMIKIREKLSNRQ